MEQGFELLKYVSSFCALTIFPPTASIFPIWSIDSLISVWKYAFQNRYKVWIYFFQKQMPGRRHPRRAGFRWPSRQAPHLAAKGHHQQPVSPLCSVLASWSYFLVFLPHILASDRCHVVRDIAFTHTCQKCCPVKIVCAPDSLRLYIFPWSVLKFLEPPAFGICFLFAHLLFISLFLFLYTIWTNQLYLIIPFFTFSINFLAFYLFIFFTVAISRNSNTHF